MRLYSLIVAVFLAGITAFGQTSDFQVRDVRRPADEMPTTYPVAGSHRLMSDWNVNGPKLEQYMRSHPVQLQKTGAWNFVVGQKRAWWATDLSEATNSEYSVPSTCRAVGTNCYIFVEDTLWSNGRVTQSAVDAIKNAFESSTPADPAKGIYQLDTEYFGTPPDVDADPRIIILILDVRDGYTGSGAYTAGYFYSLNEYPESAVQQQLGSNRHSNYAEIYYVDANPVNLATSSGVSYAALVTAHEFQHMIHWKADPNEITFVNEGMSETASTLCGYGLESSARYYANPNVSFMSWASSSDVLRDYSRTALFSWYLIEQFGSGIAKKIVQSTFTGADGYSDALVKMSTPLTFNDILKNFAVANILRDKAFDPRYGYGLSISSTMSMTKTFVDPNVSQQTETVQPRGTIHVAYTAGKSLTATFSSSSSSIAVQSIATGASGKRVSNVPLGVATPESGFGSTYDKVIYAVTNLGTSAATVSYASSGQSAGLMVQEVAYDDGNPDGFLAWTTGDTAVVWFDAMPGATLDSIRVAFRRDGSIGFGLWELAGSTQVSPLGKRYGFKTVDVAGSPTFSFPYPVPYPNWRGIDVSSWNVDLSKGFAVGFVFGANSSAPALMESNEPYTTPHHSLTYAKGSSGTYGWYVFVSNSEGDSAYKYVVRAYAHTGTATGISDALEILPLSFGLQDNYPNPFNPSTTITYTLPAAGRASLRVFDLLGREVATLLDGDVSAGTHTAVWRGTGDLGESVPSGVYLCRLVWNGRQAVQRLTLIK